ncbi:MAG: AsmA-like C-terminal region-containing protein [Rubrimonas sp.]|uniref:YhdP family protein n=1 Tax=Rubrimonas sp. TaxID=2036015 RepID=UPI002FDDAEC3
MALGLAAALIGLAAAGGGALYLRLAQGPIPIEVGARWVEAALAREAPGMALRVGGLAVALDAGGGPGLVFSDMTMRDSNGATLFEVPRARMGFRPLDLLAGRLRPTGVAISGAAVVLRREASGRFSFAVDTEGGAPDGFAAVAAALEAWEAGAPGPLAALREIALDTASMRYEDAASGRVWRSSGATLIVAREASGRLSAQASARLEGGAFGPTRLTAEGWREADGGAALRLGFAQAEPSALADQFPALDALRALRAPVRGELRAALDGAGALRDFDGRLRIGAGSLAVDGAEATALRGGALDLAYDPARGRYDILRAELDAAPAAVALSGFLAAEPEDGAFVAQVEIDALSLRDPALFAAPVAFDGGGALARLDMAAGTLDVAALRLERAGLTLHGRARAARDAAGGWSGEGALRGRDLDAATLAALWPLPAAPGARNWVADNLESGVVDAFEIAARLGREEDSLSVGFSFRDATAHFLRPMPPIEEGAGWGVATLKQFGLAMTKGRVRAPSGGEVRLTGGALRLPDANDPRALSVVEIEGRGAISAVLDLIDAEPLALTSKLDLDPQSVGGAAEVRAWLTLPLVRDLALEDVGVDVEAALADVVFDPPGLDATLRAPRATLSASAAQMRVAGEGTLAPRGGEAGPLRFDWTELFSSGPDAPSTRLSIAAALAPANAAAFGIDVAQWRGGTASVDAEVALGPGSAAAFDLRLDLAQAALVEPALNWEKPAGAAASARLEGRLPGAGDGAVTLGRIDFDAPGLTARGAARLDAQGALETVDLSRLRLGRSDVSLSATRTPEGLAATVRGARLDLAALGDAGAHEGQTGETALAATVDLDVDRLDLTDALSLRAARGRLARSSQGSVSAQVDGALVGREGAPAVAILSFEGAEAGGSVRIRSSDGGGALRAAGLFGDALGGALDVEARVTRGAAMRIEGTARLRDVTVIDDPALRAMLAEARLEAAQERLETEGGLAFDAVRAEFALEDDLFDLSEFVATGPTIGLTMQGGYDLAADRLAMTGVFTPLYQINSALGAIPLLGALLTGGEGEGLIGFNFALDGPAADPQVRVNPLSALTPGVFRALLDLGAAPPDPEAEANRAAKERNR